jgi:phosphohistidine phosphatase SixA
MWFGNGAALAANCANPPAKAFIVRHANTNDLLPDRPLSETGWKRARALAELIGPEQVSTIYVTELRRTKETAQPLVERLGIKPVEIEQESVTELCRQLCSTPAKQKVVVVGHSNTVPEILSCLGASSGGSIEYGDLFVMTFPQGKATLSKMRYGD